MARKSYAWYVEPLDSLTNIIIVRELPEENFDKKLVKGDNHPRPLWSCPTWFIRDLCRSRNHLNAKFKIYSQVGQGEIRECTFLYQKKKNKKKKTAV